MLFLPFCLFYMKAFLRASCPNASTESVATMQMNQCGIYLQLAFKETLYLHGLMEHALGNEQQDRG